MWLIPVRARRRMEALVMSFPQRVMRPPEDFYSPVRA
jgi:hypothetical protein